MTVLFLVLAVAEPWALISDAHGFTVERRKHEAFPGYAVRVRTETSVNPKALFEVLWNNEDFPSYVPTSKSVTVLERKPFERLVYEQVKMPIVKDRDYTVRSRYQHDEQTGLYTIEWKGASEAGPPENKDHVRIRFTEGSWTLEPSEGGKTIVTYVVASETGGSFPLWIVERAQRDAAVDFVKLIIERARKRS